MPLKGWDHIELWVGNAKQAADFYENAFGFTRTAYAGPETGVRDRASYVVEQGDIRLVLTSPLREEHEIARHQCRHGDGVRDIALEVPDATEAYRQAVQRGARGVAEPIALRGTEFWTERTKICIIIPSPIPATTMFRAASPFVVWTFIRHSRNIPAPRRIGPISVFGR